VFQVLGRFAPVLVRLKGRIGAASPAVRPLVARIILPLGPHQRR
jgi:hypothetical protein